MLTLEGKIMYPRRWLLQNMTAETRILSDGQTDTNSISSYGNMSAHKKFQFKI